MGEFLPYFTLTLGTVLASWGLGVALRQLVWPRAEASYFRLFLELLLGLGIGVELFALFKTRGWSVLWPMALLLLGIGWLQRRATATLAPTEDATLPTKWLRPGRVVLTLSGITLGVFGLRFLLLYDAHSSFLRTPYEDFVFYARIANNLNAGIETLTLEHLYPQFVTGVPYHYLELWLTTLLTDMTGLPAVFTLYLVSYSVLLVMLYVGWRAVGEHLGLRRGSVAVVLPAVLLLLTGTYWPFYNRVGLLYNMAAGLSSLLPVGPKLLPVFLGLTLALLLLMRRQYLAMACALSLLPLLFITTGPGVVAALAALGLVLWWQSRSWAIGLRAILVLSAVIVFIGLLYLLQPAAVRIQGEFDSLRNALPKLSEARLLVNVFLGYCLAIAAYFGPVAALVAAVWWAARHQLKTALPSWVMVGAACWLVMLLAGLATWTIGLHYLDAFQFFSNIGTPAIVLAIGALLTGGISRLRLGGQWAVMFLLCGLLSVNLFTLNTRIYPMHLTRHYAPAFLQAVRDELPRVAPAGGGFWFADSSYHNSFDMMADSHIAGAYVFNFANYSPITSLSALSVDSIGTDPRFRGNPIDALRKQQNSTIYRFQQLEGRGLPADSLPLRLARRAGLRYVCAGSGVRLPANWQPRILRMHYDPVSHETLYILKPW